MTWEMPRLGEQLQQRLQGKLPGASAQYLMAPVPRPGWDPAATAPAGRPAAVLVLLYPAPSAATAVPTLLLTERTEDVEDHRGQVSFPGGRIEAGESAEEAALREAEEETAVPRAAPHVCGRLSELWIPATGYTVTPVVATCEARPALRANPREVRRIIEMPLAELLRPGAVRFEAHSADGRWTRIRYFDVAGSRLWGATAMMTAELLTLLDWTGP